MCMFATMESLHKLMIRTQYSAIWISSYEEWSQHLNIYSLAELEANLAIESIEVIFASTVI